MNKTLLNLGLSFVLLGAFSPLFSQTYTIQMGTFIDKIESTYFDFAGLSDVHHEMGPHNFHQYLWGKFPTYEAALTQAILFQKQKNLTAFNNIKIVPTQLDNSMTTHTSSLSIKTVEHTDLSIFSRSLAFPKTSLSLQSEQVKTLENIVAILTSNPELKLRIIGEKGATIDGKIKDQPIDVVEQFLLANNIPAYRLKQIPRSPSEQITEKRQVIMALVNLKEEIILDRFDSNNLMVKQMTDPKSNNLLE